MLFADEKNSDSIRTNQLRKLFFREQVLSNSKVVLEKLPINNFRLKFLKKSFPKAKFIYLTRNGLEVSKSIERRIQKQNENRLHIINIQQLHVLWRKKDR